MQSRVFRIATSGCALAFLAGSPAGATSLSLMTHDEVRDPSRPAGEEVVSTQDNHTDIQLIPGFIEGPIGPAMSESQDGSAETASSASSDLGILEVSASHAIEMIGSLREALSLAMASYTDELTFAGAGLTGPGSVTVSYVITGDTSVTPPGTTSATLAITDAAGTETTLPVDPGTHSFTLDFEYGVPFDLVVELSVETEGLELGAAGDLTRRFEWGGISDLPPSAAVGSSSGTDWSVAVPEPGTALLLGSGLLLLAGRRRLH